MYFTQIECRTPSQAVLSAVRDSLGKPNLLYMYIACLRRKYKNAKFSESMETGPVDAATDICTSNISYLYAAWHVLVCIYNDNEHALQL